MGVKALDNNKEAYTMKKFLLSIFILTLSLTASAQSYNDSFVDWTDSDAGRISVDWAIVFPASHFTNTDQTGAPLGSGLLILTTLGAGYAVKLRSHSHRNPHGSKRCDSSDDRYRG